MGAKWFRMLNSMLSIWFFSLKLWLGEHCNPLALPEEKTWILTGILPDRAWNKGLPQVLLSQPRAHGPLVRPWLWLRVCLSCVRSQRDPLPPALLWAEPRTACAVPFISEVMLRKICFHEERGCTQLASCNAVCLEGLAQNIRVLVQEDQESLWCIIWKWFVHQCLERLAFSLVSSNYTYHQRRHVKADSCKKAELQCYSAVVYHRMVLFSKEKFRSKAKSQVSDQDPGFFKIPWSWEVLALEQQLAYVQLSKIALPQIQALDPTLQAHGSFLTKVGIKGHSYLVWNFHFTTRSVFQFCSLNSSWLLQKPSSDLSCPLNQQLSRHCPSGVKQRSLKRSCH